MKFARGLAVIGGALAMVPSAHAIPLNTPTTICLTLGSISSCASVTVTVNTGTKVLTASMTALNTAPTNTPYFIGAFGFFAYGGTTNMLTLDPVVEVSGPDPQYSGSYAYYNGASALDGGEKPAGSTWLGGATKYRSLEIPAGGTGTFTFKFTGTLPSEIFFAWHGQGWDGPGTVDSFKCYEGQASNPAGGVCGSVVPEPASMALLATGLVGLGGVGLIRRRRHG